MYQYNAEVLKVIDADTIDVRVDLGFSIFRDERLRVLNYDAPEIKLYSGVSEEEKELGLLAKKRAEELLSVGQKIVIRTQKDRTGKYGRMLADIVIPGYPSPLGGNYAEIMISEGYIKEDK